MKTTLTSLEGGWQHSALAKTRCTHHIIVPKGSDQSVLIASNS